MPKYCATIGIGKVRCDITEEVYYGYYTEAW